MNLDDKFKKELDTCSLDLFDKNIDRGAVFLLNGNLDIISVAKAIAEDQVQSISNWLNSEELIKFTKEMVEENKNFQFQYLIIQPYVIIKKVS